MTRNLKRSAPKVVSKNLQLLNFNAVKISAKKGSKGLI
ncbi:hypothetical protein K3495_g9169 [Podosphaera aphanis]|nr:hypothetical protein K3495_g9169 [Podosphaera aphanis]